MCVIPTLLCWFFVVVQWLKCSQFCKPIVLNFIRLSPRGPALRIDFQYLIWLLQVGTESQKQQQQTPAWQNFVPAEFPPGFLIISLSVLITEFVERGKSLKWSTMTRGLRTPQVSMV